MIYIGIDPGKHGAMAIIYGDGSIRITTFDESRYINALSDVAESGEDAVCCLEHVSAMPGQGVTSMFSFGQNFGWIQGVLSVFNIAYELVRPQKWKKVFSITSDKNTSVEACKRLFPQVSLLPTERCSKPSDGMAEALLMAEYARRCFGRENKS